MNNAYYSALNLLCQPIYQTSYPRALTPLKHLLALMGSPQFAYPAVVVAGSVGKGTTAHRLAALLQAAGMRVGLYTSPHLHSFRERIRINGEAISPRQVIDGTHRLALGLFKLGQESYHNFSTFERTTALALDIFAHEAVDIAVLEVGLGGRWDAVNVVENTLAIITPIEREHLGILGGSIQSIAWHKAGVIKRGGRAIVAMHQEQEVFETILAEAEQKDARLYWEAAEHLPYLAYRDLVDRHIAPSGGDIPELDITLPGRLEQIQIEGSTIIIDGGHTPLAARHLMQTIGNREATIVIGMLGDKVPQIFLRAFDQPQLHIIFTTAPSHRGLPPTRLRREGRLQYAAVEIEQDLSAALQRHKDARGLFVVTGSLRMAAAAREFFGLLDAEAEEEARRTRAIFDGEDYLKRLR